MEKPVATKLQIKPGDTLAVLEGTDERIALLEPLPAEVVVVSGAAEPHQVAVLFAQDRAALNVLLDAALPHLSATRARWVVYPKANRADINRDSIWGIVRERGWTLNGNVSVDEVWSAVRMKPM